MKQEKAKIRRLRNKEATQVDEYELVKAMQKILGDLDHQLSAYFEKSKEPKDQVSSNSSE